MGFGPVAAGAVRVLSLHGADSRAAFAGVESGHPGDPSDSDREGKRGVFHAPRAIVSYLGPVFKSTEGHIVIRVEPGGAKYQVVILDDTSAAQLVTAVHGPYASR